MELSIRYVRGAARVCSEGKLGPTEWPGRCMAGQGQKKGRNGAQGGAWLLFCV